MLSRVVDEPDVGLVHKGSRIERFVAVPLASLPPGHLMQLVVDERKQLCKSLAVSRSHLVEKTIYDVLVSVTHRRSVPSHRMHLM